MKKNVAVVSPSWERFFERIVEEIVEELGHQLKEALEHVLSATLVPHMCADSGPSCSGAVVRLALQEPLQGQSSNFDVPLSQGG